MKSAKVSSDGSYLLTGIGIVVGLHHHEQGLPEKTRLIASDQRIWEVVQRVFYSPIVREQTWFDSENPTVAHLVQHDKKKANEMRERILARDAERIFDYLIRPINHEEKPAPNEVLRIEFTKF